MHPVLLYSVRLSVRTTAFQVVKTGSIPVLSTKYTATLAQMDRAPGYELGGQEFESLRSHQDLTIIKLSSILHFLKEMT